MSGQDIKPGYKRTEVGVIPEEWEVRDIRSMNFDISDGNYSSKYPKSSDFRSIGIPFIRANNIRDLTVIDDDLRFISVAQHQELQKGHLKANDILITTRGEIGQLAIVPNRHINSNIKAQLVRINCSQTEMDHRFLVYAMSSKNAREQFENLQTGSALKQLPVGRLIQFTLPVPRPEEQRAIATALSDVDSLLAKLDELIAKKRDLKQATMQQLLTGQTRLPGFSGAWEVKRLGALGSTYGGLTGKTKDDFGRGDAQYIPFMNVMTDTVIDPNWLEQVDLAPGEVQNIAKRGDLFFNGSSETPEEVGYCSVLLEDIPNLYLNSFCFGFRFNADANVNGLFFAYWFRCEQGRKAMSVLAQGATRYNISKSAFLQLEIPQPSADEQTAIATVLSDIDAELATLESRRDKTRSLKQGMMQELLTGRIRLV